MPERLAEVVVNADTLLNPISNRRSLPWALQPIGARWAVLDLVDLFSRVFAQTPEARLCEERGAVLVPAGTPDDAAAVRAAGVATRDLFDLFEWCGRSSQQWTMPDTVTDAEARGLTTWTKRHDPTEWKFGGGHHGKNKAGRKNDQGPNGPRKREGKFGENLRMIVSLPDNADIKNLPTREGGQ